jgi:putative transposase
VLVVAQAEAAPLPATGRSVGVDLGVARFLTTSDGEIIANPRFPATAQERLTDLQRRKQHARPGSGNRRRLRRALAKEWRKLRNQRRDFHHKTVVCPVHGDLDADLNGARNIATRAGLGSGQASAA